MAEKVYLFAKTYDDEASGRVFSAGPYPWRVVDTELQARIDALGADQVTELTALQGVPAQVARLSAQVTDLGALVAAADLAYATKSALDADTGQDDDALALVFDDSTAANNGLYKSTTGAWSKTSLQLANPTELGQAVDFAGRNFFGVSTSAGTRDDLTTGSDLANNTFVFYTALPEGVLLEFRVFTLGSGTVKLKLFSKSGSTFTQQGADIELSVGSGLNVFTPEDFGYVTVSAGWYVGLYAPDAAFTSGSASDYDRAYIGSGDTSSLTDASSTSSSVAIQARVTVRTPTTDASGYDELQSLVGVNAAGAARSIDAVFAQMLDSQLVGRKDADPDSGSGFLGSNTFVFDNPIPAGVLRGLKVYADSAGELTLRLFIKSGDTFTRTGTDTVVSLSAGLNALDFSDLAIIVPDGAYLGVYSADGVVRVGGSSSSYDQIYTGTGNVTSFTDDATTALVLQIQADIALFDSIADISAEATSAKTVTDQIGRADIFETADLVWKDGEAIPDGASNAGSAEYLFRTPVSADGRLTALRGYSPSGGAVTVYVRSSDGAVPPNFALERSQTVTVGSGSFTAALDLEVNEGEFLGVSGQVTGRLRFTGSAPDPTPYYLNSSAGASTFEGSSVQSAIAIHVGFEAKLDRLAKFPNRITVANSDRITILGDSTGTPGFTIRKKGWLHKLSMFSDYCFENFSLAGDDFSEILDRIQTGAKTYGAAYRDYNTTFAVLISGINDAAAYSFDTYLENIRQVANTVRGFGAELIFSTELRNVYGAEVIVPAMRQLAGQYGGRFVNLRATGRKYGDSSSGGPGYYAGFWSSVHPGIRSGELYFVPMREAVDALPRPRQSLKVFTPRETPAAVADLAFDDLAARAALFQEIQIGERAFTTATEKYYDEIDEGAFTHETLASDYLALIAGDSVSISDYALIDIILPCTYAGLDRLQAYLGATGVSAWVLKVDTDSPGAGDPLCEPISLTVDANGQINLAKSQLRGCVRGDRVSFIVYKSGGFEMNAPWVDWYGVAGKPDFPPAPARATGSELLGQTLCGETAELADWTHTTGTVTGAAPLDSPPDGVTKVALVTDANTLGQGLTLGGLDVDADTEVEVTVTARNFPPLFDSTDTYPDDSQITATSHDFVNLVVSLRYGDSYSVPFTAPVGLWWTPVRFRTFIPAGSTDVRLFIASEGGALQIAEASVKVP